MTPEQTAVLTQRLAAAEAAYHDLLLGVQGRVFVDANGERIETTPANRSALQAYIQDLRRQLGMNDPAVSGPFRVYF